MRLAKGRGSARDQANVLTYMAIAHHRRGELKEARSLERGLEKATLITRYLGEQALTVLERLMGMLLVCMAVQMLVSGIGAVRNASSSCRA